MSSQLPATRGTIETESLLGKLRNQRDPVVMGGDTGIRHTLLGAHSDRTATGTQTRE